MAYLRASRRDREVLSLVIQRTLELQYELAQRDARLIGDELARRL